MRKLAITRIVRGVAPPPTGNPYERLIKDALQKGLADGLEFLAIWETNEGHEIYWAKPNTPPAPIDMLLWCPQCGVQHIDNPDPTRGWDNPPHRSHECQGCKHIWRPSDALTNGVAKIKTEGKHDGDAAPALGELRDTLQRLIDNAEEFILGESPSGMPYKGKVVHVPVLIEVLAGRLR
jgi:rubredoxin